MTPEEITRAMNYRPTLGEVFINHCSHHVTEQRVNHTELGYMLRKLRLAQCVSLRTMAAGMGFTAPFISDLERGRRNWTPAHVANFLKLLPQQPEPPSLKIR